MPRPNDDDWEEDANMQYLLKRKRRLEELEEYNMPEAMLKKRRAVKEEARRRPALRVSTDLDFDDDIEVSEPTGQTSPHPSPEVDREEEDEEFAEWMACKSKRGRRRVRCAMRKQATKAQQQHQQQQQQQVVEAAR